MKTTFPGLLLSAAVLGAALFAFSPRPLPAFPATTIQGLSRSASVA
jgi:hypothetical protein